MGGVRKVFEWDERKRRSNLCGELISMKKRATSKRSKTDWKRVDAMRDEDIDYSDNPPWTPEMFARAVVRVGFKPVPPKEQITLRVDADVLKWFRARGSGYQTLINALLRAYMNEHLQQQK